MYEYDRRRVLFAIFALLSENKPAFVAHVVTLAISV